MYLVLIETSANQNYIFATNKLRENVGASELTWRVGTQFVLEAVKQAGGPTGLFDSNSAHLRRNLLDPKLNPPLELGSQTDATNVEVVLATSGKAMLLVRDKPNACGIVSHVTRRALEEAPGVDIRGAVAEVVGNDQQSLPNALTKCHQQLELLRGSVPGPESRFQRLPVVAPCTTSGLPASCVLVQQEGTVLRSYVAHRKYEAGEAGRKRMVELAMRDETTNKLKLAESIDDLDKLESIDWLAVVHADGNGLGQVFQRFHEFAGVTSVRDYVTKLRQFSLALDYCTEQAFRLALAKSSERWKRRGHAKDILPVVPIVLGGDDLTVVCDGRLAVQFARDFLIEFERLTGDEDLKERIDEIGKTSFKQIIPKTIHGAAELFVNSVSHATSAAGVAIVKPHFPFHAAYELADDLLESAKRLLRIDGKRVPCSALDFHVLYDASGADLERIRRKWRVDGGGTHLFVRPYIVSQSCSDNATNPIHLDTLEDRIVAVKARDENGRRVLPSHMLHELREGLFLGRKPAEARFDLVRNRYGRFFRKLLVDDNLFWDRKLDGQDVAVTALLDAMELAEFWQTSGEGDE